MFFFLSKTLDIFLSPLVWALACWSLSFFALIKWPEKRKTSLTIAASGCILLFVFSLTFVGNALTWKLESMVKNTAQTNVTYQAIILLGGMVHNGVVHQNEVPNYGENVDRLLTTFDLLRTGKAQSVFISGGIPHPRPEDRVEATILRDQLIAWGIEPHRVVVDPFALNTRENAVNAAQWIRTMHYDRVLLITSAMHMRRASACFRAKGLSFDVLSVDQRSVKPAYTVADFLPRSDALTMSTDALRELFGYWIYRWQGYID